MTLMLTLVRNKALETLLAEIPQGRYVAYLEGKGWRRREANKVPKVKIWEYRRSDIKNEKRFFGGEVFPHCHVMSVPADFCFERNYADVGRRCWELVTKLACLEQRAPLSVLCEIDPSICNFLDTSCKSSAGSSPATT